MFWSMKKRRERENPRIAAPKMAPSDSSLKKYCKTSGIQKNNPSIDAPKIASTDSSIEKAPDIILKNTIDISSV